MLSEIKLFKVSLIPVRRESNVIQVDIICEVESKDKATWVMDGLPSFLDQDLTVEVIELLQGYKKL